jgi:hypothetical protein
MSSNPSVAHESELPDWFVTERRARFLFESAGRPDSSGH